MAPPLSGLLLATFAAVAGAQDVFLPGDVPSEAADAAPSERTPEFWNRFQTFISDFKREYANEEERVHRFGAFVANMRRIIAHNEVNVTYSLGINDFTDLTSEEFRAQRLGFKRPAQLWGDLPHVSTRTLLDSEPPASVDWVSEGAVTPVKDQGTCGGCWAFSTTGALESAAYITSGLLQSLSEQQLIDCDVNQNNQGCQGGSMEAAFIYSHDNWMCSESEYPYKGVDGSCQRTTSTYGLPKSCVEGYAALGTRHTMANEQELMQAVAQQPISVAIEADQYAFQLYSSGIVEGKCGDALDHGVLVVGYGEDGGVAYWKVKNSWGKHWGESGYVRILRGQDECGILSEPSYPVISSSCMPNQQPNIFQNPWVIGGIVLCALLVLGGCFVYCRARKAAATAAARGPPLVPAVSTYNGA